jgi:hypothetical protein
MKNVIYNVRAVIRILKEDGFEENCDAIVLLREVEKYLKEIEDE